MPPSPDALQGDFSSLFNFLPIGAYRTSPDGTMLRVNPAFVALAGYEDEAQMLAAGPSALPFVFEAMEAGWQGDHVGAAHCAPLASTYFNMRKTTIYGGSNEVQRNIVAKTVLG